MVAGRLRAGKLRSWYLAAVAAVATLALAAVPASATAAVSPVLEFAPSGGAFPVEFEAVGGEVTAALAGVDSVVRCKESEGLGLVTGPRSAEGTYWFYDCETQGGSQAGRKCSSAGAEPGEIETEVVDARLVFISQVRREVGVVLAPAGELYMAFDCEGVPVTAYGPFVSPVGPVNLPTSSFTATLTAVGAAQIPSAYEGVFGETVPAVPMGSWSGGAPVTSGVNLAFAITTFDATGLAPLPLEIKARTAAELEAEARQREEAEAAERKRQEDEAAAKAAAAKRQQEEAAAAEAKKRAEEEARKKAANAKKPPTRAERLAKALKRCRKLDSKEKRASCRKNARSKYGPQKKGAHKKGAHKKGKHRGERQ